MCEVVREGQHIISSPAERLAVELERLAAHLPHGCLFDREFDALRVLASGLAVSQITERSVRDRDPHDIEAAPSFEMRSASISLRAWESGRGRVYYRAGDRAHPLDGRSGSAEPAESATWRW